MKDINIGFGITLRKGKTTGVAKDVILTNYRIRNMLLRKRKGGKK